MASSASRALKSSGNQEVRNQFGGGAAAKPAGFGGRNRLLGGVSDTGGGKSPAGARGAGGRAALDIPGSGGLKGGADALQGTYSADKIAQVGGIQKQIEVRRDFKPQRAPFDPTMKLESQGGESKKAKLPHAKADPKSLGSQQQSEKGEFGQMPGYAARRLPYRSNY